VVVQDIFMTKTAEVADVLLPATSWGEHGGVLPALIADSSVLVKPSKPAGM
jgi:anaerobic selenocysteine-containing dehydrogenase